MAGHGEDQHDWKRWELSPLQLTERRKTLSLSGRGTLRFLSPFYQVYNKVLVYEANNFYIEDLEEK